MRPDPHPGDVNRNDYCSTCLARNRSENREIHVLRLPGALLDSFRWAATRVLAGRVEDQARAIRGLDDLTLEIAEERVADARALRDSIPVGPIDQLVVSGPWSVLMDIFPVMLEGMSETARKALAGWDVSETRAYLTAMRCVLDAESIIESAGDANVPEGADFLLVFEVGRLAGLMLDGMALGRRDVAITALDSLATTLPALRARIETLPRTPLRAVAA